MHLGLLPMSSKELVKKWKLLVKKQKHVARPMPTKLYAPFRQVWDGPKLK
jgi:hypothetical protein